MNKIDYACGINCPEDHDDEQMLMDFVVNQDCELCYLDTYLKETFGKNNVLGENANEVSS